jgi:hypothetical protein
MRHASAQFNSRPEAAPQETSAVAGQAGEGSLIVMLRPLRIRCYCLGTETAPKMRRRAPMGAEFGYPLNRGPALLLPGAILVPPLPGRANAPREGCGEVRPGQAKRGPGIRA